MSSFCIQSSKRGYGTQSLGFIIYILPFLTRGMKNSWNAFEHNPKKQTKANFRRPSTEARARYWPSMQQSRVFFRHQNARVNRYQLFSSIGWQIINHRGALEPVACVCLVARVLLPITGTMAKIKVKQPDRVLLPGRPDLERCDNKVVSARYTALSFFPVVRSSYRFLESCLSFQWLYC